MFEEYKKDVWTPLWQAGYRCWALVRNIEITNGSLAAVEQRAKEDCPEAGRSCGFNVFCTLHDFDIGEQVAARV